MAKKTEVKDQTAAEEIKVTPEAVVEEAKETSDEGPTRVTIDMEKVKAIYGFVPTTLYVIGKQITEDNLTFEVTKEQLVKIQDFI